MIELTDMRDHCICGAVLGSLLSILRFHVDRRGLLVAAFLSSYSEILATFMANAAIAYIYGPVACEVLIPYLGVEVNQNSCIALSGAVATLSPWLVAKLIPAIGEKVLGTVKSLNPREILERLLRLWDDSKRGKK